MGSWSVVNWRCRAIVLAPECQDLWEGVAALLRLLFSFCLVELGVDHSWHMQASSDWLKAQVEALSQSLLACAA